MKAFKKVFASAMVTAMLATMGVSAFAQSIPDSEIQPYGARCPDCATGVMYLSSTTKTEWYTVEYVPCRHGYPNKLDRIDEREITNIYTCGNCKISRPSKFVEERCEHEN